MVYFQSSSFVEDYDASFNLKTAKTVLFYNLVLVWNFIIVLQQHRALVNSCNLERKLFMTMTGEKVVNSNWSFYDFSWMLCYLICRL